MKFYKGMETPKAITFDLDDTLYANHDIIVHAEIALLAFIHQHYPQAQHTNRAYWQSYSRQLTKARPELLNDMSLLRRLTLAQGFQGCGYTGDRLDAAVEECYSYFYFERSDFHVVEPLVELLRLLSKKVPLVAITNGNVDVERIGLHGIFRHTFKASLSQPRKPDSTMFLKASDSLGLAPHQCLHVGDNFQADIQGAINAGFKAAWYAYDPLREMNNEAVSVLPHIVLDRLDELLDLFD